MCWAGEAVFWRFAPNEMLLFISLTLSAVCMRRLCICTAQVVLAELAASVFSAHSSFFTTCQGLCS